MNLGQETITWIELLGTLTGIAGVWLTVRQNIWCFPVGMINVILYAAVFYQSRLYGDAALQIFYVALLAYGWQNWQCKKSRNELLVTKLNPRQWVFSLGFLAAGTYSIHFLLSRYTNSDIAEWDALTTSMSLLAQWMIAQKKIENWILWVIADFIYIGMYLHKGLYFTAFLYFVFIVLAVKGYFDWKKSESAYVR